jgi:hypothetical protein
VIDVLADDGHHWLRVADPGWDDPLDGSYAANNGGRWTPPGSWDTLYLNFDVVTARRQIEHMLEGQPVQIEDLADDAYILIGVRVPDGQRALDVVTAEGVDDVGLPATYPADGSGERVDHKLCWPIAEQAHDAGLDAVWCRSAATLDGVGREFAWWQGDRQAQAVTDPIPLGQWRDADIAV